MKVRSMAAVATVVVLTLSLYLFPTTSAHNITHILAKYPQFSSFNHYLTETHLAADINNRETITVCAVDNAGMSELLSKHLPIHTIKNVISLHILLDYFGAKKLHQITNGTALAATMFQATGSAPGSTGFVNITDMKGGKVKFGPAENHGLLPATFVKAIEEIPYNISVIQISTMLPSEEAEAPSPEPSKMNLTELMSAHGCKVFAETLLKSTAAEKTYEDNVQSGLTVFCPGDDAMKNFIPKYKNLSVDGKQSLLEYHGVPVYQSMSGLKSNNGEMNTLATDGAKKYDFTVQNNGDVVTLKTKIVTATITGTLIDEQPVAIFTINKVLMPKELFKASAADTPAPAPAPGPDADVEAPKSSKKKKHKAPAAADTPADSPADGPSDDSGDLTADDNGGVRYSGGGLVAGVLSVWFLFLLL